MKANELMIGDWVHLVKKTPLKEIVETDCMTKVTALPGGVIYTDKEPCEESQLFPIPLTSKILRDNKFSFYPLMGEQCHFTYYLGPQLSLLAIYDADFSFRIGEQARKVLYVHQLQHIMRLCGIEKEIAL